MITPPWKKIILAVVAAGLVGAIIYFKTDTEKKDKPFYINPAFGEYITSYTTGVISSGSSLTIGFSRDMVDSSATGETADGDLFSFSPSIAGSTVWLDTRTVQFRPRDRMSSGERYGVKFHLSKLLGDLPEDLRTFEYAFRVIPQNFDVQIVNTKAYNQNDLQRQKIEGILLTADYAEASKVENTMAALQGGTNLDVRWTHAEDGRQHHFVVENVVRKDQPGKVEVTVAGRSIGMDRNENVTVEIPSLDDFKLMQTRVIQSPSQYVILQFSDPIKADQNLNGLIRINGLPDLDFDVHDNEIWVYPPVRQNESKIISIEGSIRNSLDRKLNKTLTESIVFEQVKPAVRFTGKGSILPATDGLVVPFEAVNLNAVDIQITKVYESNVLQFFQVNNLDRSAEIRRVGNRILRKKIPLENTGISDPGKWNRYTLDISKLIQSEPGAIYEVRLGFKKSYSTFGCAVAGDPDESRVFDELSEEADDSFAGEYNMGYYDYYYYGEGFDWNQRENPCHDSYYTPNRAVSKNVLASDVGLTAKRGEDGRTLVFVTDLQTAKPITGVQVILYSFQLQEIGKDFTDTDGKVVVHTGEVPFAVVARNGVQRGYLRMVNGEALMVSNFDVSGEVIQKGLKGFLYGERGVWRPGDSLHLTFILEDKRKMLPRGHPVVFELSNPQGQVTDRIVRSVSENGFYSFATTTSADAPTGNWLGRVKVGGTVFTQTLKIETVKPNRLKINLDFAAEKFTSADIRGELNVNWLHGAPGRNLKSEFEVMLVRQPTTFAQFPNYNFDDPSREFESESQLLFEGKTDSEGKATVSARLEVSGDPSGLLNAIFRGKVFEESGNFSIDRFSIPFYPYSSFIGMRVPEGEQYSGILYTDTDHTIDIATVDADGNGISRNAVEINMYKLDWRWWWDNSNDRLANFVEGSYASLVKSETVSTRDGKASWTMNLPAAQYGRYFIRICDPTSGHCAGQVVYVDEPGWYSRARDADARGGANLLSFNTDKTKYKIGEKINLTIPGSDLARALVSIENGSKVLQTYWVETRRGETAFSFEATPEMTPNVYVHVSLLQPHAQTQNDLPIRLYGVTSLSVEDPATHLEPVINVPDVLVPGEPVVIRVSEKTNRKMTYTLAVVDEGLLDLTRFKTPDAWRNFYAREALGVRTWDLYDYVMGAFGTHLERFISVGGDDAIAPGEMDPLANRFKAVVKFFGPYTIDGETQDIRFTMPEYIGSVKTMVVAGYEGAYGNAEKVSKVKKPLMVLATLPRVLGPEELVKLPVTVFTGENDLRNIHVEVKAEGPVSVTGERSKTMTLSKNSDVTVDFDLSVRSETGVVTVEVSATSGNLRSQDIIEIQVRNPNLPVTRVEEFLMEKGNGWSTSFTPFGMPGTNSATLEISTLPPLNLESRMRQLLLYPHGCIEQTTSAVFPQLYLDQLKDLNEVEKEVIQKNVKAGIEQLRSFVQTDGGFGYWPGVSESTDTWGTSYAGHFLLEAEKKGYYVPADLIARWKSFQRNKVIAWRRNDRYYNSDLMQSYRLYTLALAGAPELGAMNRMRQEGKLTSASAWMLASAYAVAGQLEAARTLISDLPLAVKEYRELGYTYGSTLRDKALILETLVLLDERTRAFDVLKEISSAMGDHGYWMSTQETAMCLRAVSSFAGKEKRGELKFTYKLGSGKRISASTGLPLAQVPIPVTDVKPTPLELENMGNGSLFVRLITSGTPARGHEENASHQLAMHVTYTDSQGHEIDPSRLEQGTEFVAEVSVAHPGLRGVYDNLALSQVFPSGWEINNLRLEGSEEFMKTSAYQYQDIRDDRVFTYFNLSPGEEKTFRVLLTATYAGDYYLPAASCEAMYDRSIYARKKGQAVSVVKAAAR